MRTPPPPPGGRGGPAARAAPAVPTAGTRPARRARCGGPPRDPRFDGGLRRRQPRYRDAVRRAADVVHAGAMAEAHRACLSAVLAADADLEPRARGAAALDGPEHELPHAFLVEGLERVLREDAEPPLVHIVGQEA